MTGNKDILEAIRKYQECGTVHPLTCGNDSMHRNLEGKEINDKVVLICLDCDYIQTYIPTFVLSASDLVHWGDYYHKQSNSEGKVE